jgi:hypothetical protein
VLTVKSNPSAHSLEDARDGMESFIIHKCNTASCDLSYKSKKYVITIQLYLSYKSKKYVITIQLDLSYKGKKYVINNSNAPLKYSLVERLDKYISVMQT